MLGPPLPAPPPELDPWDIPSAPGTPEAAIWRERERRQRTIRLLMMFLVMLLLMDSEDGAQRRQHHALRKQLRQKNKQGSSLQLESAVFESRQSQERRIRQLAVHHERFQALIHKNGGEDVDEQVRQWAEHEAEQEKDQFAENAPRSEQKQLVRQDDPEQDRKVFHYPWNATGFYRGEWSRKDSSQTERSGSKTERESQAPATDQPANLPDKPQSVVKDARALESTMTQELRDRNEAFGVLILPDGLEMEVRDDNNLTSLHWESLKTDSKNAIIRDEKVGFASTKSDVPKQDGEPGITLTHTSGRAAFQLFSRSIPSMKELSLVDGFVKLYDSTSPGYSTRKDILLRVRGVLIHAIGRLSLVSNVEISRSAFVIGGHSADIRRRRLMESLAALNEANIESVRDDAISLFPDSNGGQDGEYDWMMSSPGWEHRRLELETEEEGPSKLNETATQNSERTLVVTTTLRFSGDHDSTASTDVSSTGSQSPKDLPAWSDIVLPYPFVRDDKKETVRRTKTPASRNMPTREQALEDNAAGCGFEINMDIGEEEWAVGAWRKLVGRRINDLKRLDPSRQREEGDNEGEESIVHLRGLRPKLIQDQALVMTMVGSIHSPNCDFTANLNATALRTNWETTTSRAINYSFVMMLVCLTQILILLRQLLHSQGQSAASRVSLLCIGWQTLIDALLCLGHIYMSLSIQPLFSAFASVSFFKLLIFCVIEMKYMAIIIQARNSSNGGQTTEVLRRQIAMLHLRFYCAMAASFLLFFYIGDKYRTLYILTLYSFWVPQIIMNVLTEAKTPMHTSYIYGMSVTRMLAPLYLFGIRNNFLREVYPEAPYDPFMCQMLVLWVGIQTALLIGQGKYGARFLIPARFLPPKFDYSRPIPAAMLPPGALDVPTNMEAMEDREDSLRLSPNSERQSLISETSPSRGRHTTAETTRNRIRGKNRATRSESGMMTTEEHHTTTSATSDVTSSSPTNNGNSSSLHSLECSICYEPIDVRKRHDYMLAPCNHLFHRECLVQWMDVKMECPICRTELPAL